MPRTCRDQSWGCDCGELIGHLPAVSAVERQQRGLHPAGAPLPTVASLRAAPWWSYVGGFIVAFYVLTITFLAPRLGVGTAISLIVTGQIAAALTIDHFGLLRSPVFTLTPARLVGAALMAAGVFLALRR